MKNKKKVHQLKAARSRYVRFIPKTVPEGWAVVHNHVIPVHPIGLNGFRVWIQERRKSPKLERCDCGWAPSLAVHYRVRRKLNAIESAKLKALRPKVAAKK